MACDADGWAAVIDAEQRQLVNECLDRFAEGLLVDLADSPDDEAVPIGLLLIETFEADERGWAFDPALREFTLTAAELRQRCRVMRGVLADEAT